MAHQSYQCLRHQLLAGQCYQEGVEAGQKAIRLSITVADPFCMMLQQCSRIKAQTRLEGCCIEVFAWYAPSGEQDSRMHSAQHFHPKLSDCAPVHAQVLRYCDPTLTTAVSPPGIIDHGMTAQQQNWSPFQLAILTGSSEAMLLIIDALERRRATRHLQPSNREDSSGLCR